MQAYVAEGCCVVVFEGTHDFRHWPPTPANLHRAGSDCASLRLQRPARVTRDFLGTAMEGIAAMSLDSYGHQVEELYTSDMSRTGDEIWAKDFNARFSDRFFRMTRHRRLFTFERATAHGQRLRFQ